MHQRQLIYRKFIIANLRRMGRLDHGAFRECVELIESRLRSGPVNAHFPDIEAELAILAHEERLFRDDAEGYFASAETEPAAAEAPAATPAQPEPQRASASEGDTARENAPAADPPLNLRADRLTRSADRPAADVTPEAQTETLPAAPPPAPQRSSGGKGLLAAVAASVAAVWLLGLLFGFGGRCGLVLSSCYDSGWIAASNSVKSLTFNHNLGSLPENLQIYFSPDQAGSPAYPIESRWDQQTGNPVSVRVDRNNIYLEMWSGTSLRSVFNGETGQWTRYNSGFIRVFAKR